MRGREEDGDGLLKGAYDLHIHTGPDVIPRKLNDDMAVRMAMEAGMAGIALKSHVCSTAGRAAILNERYPEFRTISALALNSQVGGLNPAAVEAFGKMGGDIVWMPTLDAENFRRYKKESGGITVFGPGGRLLLEVDTILDLVSQYDLALATGHLGAEETLAVAEASFRKGIQKLCITHVTHPACALSISEQKECAGMGAVIEHSYGHILEGRCTLERSLQEIQSVGAESVILTTDTGQAKFPYPVEAFSEYVRALTAEGITEEEIDKMIRINPERMLKKELGGTSV